jgi:hypothetical protein
MAQFDLGLNLKNFYFLKNASKLRIVPVLAQCKIQRCHGKLSKKKASSKQKSVSNESGRPVFDGLRRISASPRCAIFSARHASQLDLCGHPRFKST